MMKTKMMILAFTAALILSGCSNSTPGPENTRNEGTLLSPGADKLTDNDRDFLQKAASGGMMEVELGKVAQQTAHNQRVKDFGAMMVRDHTKANDELKKVAADKNVNIPDSMNEHHHMMMQNLKMKTSTDFDFSYMQMMLNDHNKDVGEFRTEAKQGGDADVKAFAAKTLPVLETHLDSAKAIFEAIKNIR
jgi:putative membrane protein